MHEVSIELERMEFGQFHRIFTFCRAPPWAAEEQQLEL
jgi:hypothetical protein